MNPTHVKFLIAGTLLAAVGMWLMLPRGRKKGRLLGGLLGLGGVGCLAMLGMCLGSTLNSTVYGVVATTAVVSAAMTITFRNPVYCAIWFALSLLATAGLFMLQNAQFLGVATVVVYAGAILVTFLFVLMLANPGGNAYYDRVSWEGFLSAGTGALLIGILLYTITMTTFGPQDQVAKSPVAKAIILGASQTDRDNNILHKEHVAKLGGEMFSKHLISVEIAGTLLLVALVGAIAILGHERQTKPNAAAQDRVPVGHSPYESASTSAKSVSMNGTAHTTQATSTAGASHNG
jgi:NADH-quinone oxidoreductase subunit J